MLVVFHERERSSFAFHINQKVEERCSFQPKSQWYKGVTSHFHFLLFHNIFFLSLQCSSIYLFPLFSVPQYICFHFSFSAIYLFPLFSVPRARSVPQPPRSCCCGKWWRWQVPVYHCFFVKILFCIKPILKS